MEDERRSAVATIKNWALSTGVETGRPFHVDESTREGVRVLLHRFGPEVAAEGWRFARLLKEVLALRQRCVRRRRDSLEVSLKSGAASNGAAGTREKIAVPKLEVDQSS